MSDEMPTYDRDNLPEEFEVAGGAAWAEMVLKQPLRVIKIEGAFKVRLPLQHALRDSVGTVTMPDGDWVAIGIEGDPYAISSEEMERSFVPAGDAEQMSTGELLLLLARYVEKQGEGGIGLGFDKGRWATSTIFGREAPDSPMVGGQALGECVELRDCLLQMATECGLVPR